MNADKRKIFAANWKLNKTPKESLDFIQAIKDQIDLSKSRVFIFPQNFSLTAVVEAVKLESSRDSNANFRIEVGPQHICDQVSGAFTGENSVAIASSIGANLVLIGHSERRQYYGETDQLVAVKTKLVQDYNLTAVVCVGETLPQRQSGQTNEILKEQITMALLNADKQKEIILAYEPVWAIGTGQVATSKQVAEAHKFISELIKQMGFLDFKVLYGGSVKPDNAKELIQIEAVDGFLIGGAALKPDSFLNIAHAL